MMLTKLDTLSGRSLPFGALLTIIFKAHDVNLEGEGWIRITSPISEYTLTRADGADTLMGSINLENHPIPDEKEPNGKAMPPNEQPHYWTDYLALEQERFEEGIEMEEGIRLGLGRRIGMEEMDVDEKDQRIRELKLELYNEKQRCKRRCAGYQEQLHMVLKYVEEHAEHLSRSVQDMVQRIKELENEQLDGSD
ncbi:hypothetical protein TEA_002434 [Camellia sinensis var. sinensis]|uniref:Uncharacterized protein n=1 Tax=Camellia sinensis var. sinensis TaxID=542762 RepID=A0A4S4E8M6_CAMSN|nr:hypothetical protein TEA_002434 [Camellia sinensis var. sinensis]